MKFQNIFVIIALVCPASFALAIGISESAPNCSTAQLVVPWSKGGETDVVFRIFADSINSTGIKPQLEVINIVGQGSVLGTTQIKNAKPDGCTLIAIHENVITSYLTGHANFSYEAFAPIALVSYTPSVIGASPKAPFKSLQEMIDLAKQKPESVAVGITRGSRSHFFFLLIEDAAKVKFRYIEFEGSYQRNIALLENKIMLGETHLITTMQSIQDGSLVALGIATASRDALVKDVPTLKEQGMNIIYGSPKGVAAPKGTPINVIKFWQNAFAKASKDPIVVIAIEEKGSEVLSKGSEDYTTFLKDSFEKHRNMAIQTGIYQKK